MERIVNLTGANGLAHWRAQIFSRIVLVVLVLGIATAIPSALLAAREGMWSVSIIDMLTIAWIALIWHRRRWSYRTRVFNFLAAAFLIGAALILKVGPVSQIYLLVVPVLAALLLGLAPALWALAASGAAVLLLSWHAAPYLQLHGAEEEPLLHALIITVNYLFISAVITLSCAFLLRHLERSLDDLGASARSLEQGRNTLALLNAELRLTAAAVARLNDMVLIAEVGGVPPQTRIIFVNHAFEQRTGYARGDVLGRSLRLLHGPDTDAAELERISVAMAHAVPVRAELLHYTKAGEPYWVETELTPFADEGGNNTHWVAVERDIGERKKSEHAIHNLAFYDVLTGLPNRRLLMDRIGQLLAGVARHGDVSALMFIDLDHFKHINDARGHATGDLLLRKAAARLAGLMRKDDTVARIGGDEFVILLARVGRQPEDASHMALLVAEKVRAAMARNFRIDGQSYHCSASIGVTLLAQSGADALDLLREADIAMYRAKAGGRNGIAFFETGMQAELEARLDLERELARALDDGALGMDVQLQVGRDGRASGAEMLMRWRRPDGTQVAPSLFIPLAEESGLIVRLGNWALDQACAALVRLAAAGHALPLSVNVSPSQFRQADFVQQVQASLVRSGAPAGSLILEVTEGLLIDKLDESVRRMHELAALGVRFSIDDFGTGYSSLRYLKTMPLYELKIDKSFIDDTPHDASDTAIVQTILAMARHLGLRVVAEGVETQAQADFLLANDCDGLQGYLFARPMPLAAVLERLALQA